MEVTQQTRGRCERPLTREVEGCRGWGGRRLGTRFDTWDGGGAGARSEATVVLGIEGAASEMWIEGVAAVVLGLSLGGGGMGQR